MGPLLAGLGGVVLTAGPLGCVKSWFDVDPKDRARHSADKSTVRRRRLNRCEPSMLPWVPAGALRLRILLFRLGYYVAFEPYPAAKSP